METGLIVAAAALALLVVAAGLVLSRHRRRSARAHRLDTAFERARYARRTGTMGSDRSHLR